MDDGDYDVEQGELFRLTFATGIAEKNNIGFYAQDRAAQTDSNEMIPILELTEVVRRMTKDCDTMKRDLGITKAVLASEFSRRLETRALELYSRMNDQVTQLERGQEERVAVVRRAFKAQLTDALIRVRNIYDGDFSKRMGEARAKQAQEAAAKDTRIRQLEDHLTRNEQVIALLKQQLAEAQNRPVSSPKQSQQVVVVPPRTPSPKSPRFTKADMAEKDKEIRKLKSKIAQLEENLESQTANNSSFSEEKAALEAEIADLRAQLDQAVADKAAITERLEEAQAAIKAAEAANEETWRKELAARVQSAKDRAEGELNTELEKVKTEAQRRYDELLYEKEELEKKIAKEREEYLLQLEKLKDVEVLRKREQLLQAQVTRLKAELERMTRMWEKKFQVLRQSMHALKDESFLRQTMQRQAAQLHQAAVMYATDLPVGSAPLPSVGQTGAGARAHSHNAGDQFSYTMSLPRTAQSGGGGGIGFFSEDEDQVLGSENEEELPTNMRPLPSPPTNQKAKMATLAR